MINSFIFTMRTYYIVDNRLVGNLIVVEFISQDHYNTRKNKSIVFNFNKEAIILVKQEIFFKL